MDWTEWIGMALAIILTFSLGVALGYELHERHAIRAGVAEYYLDADHERQFRFLTNRAEKPQ